MIDPSNKLESLVADLDLPSSVHFALKRLKIENLCQLLPLGPQDLLQPRGMRRAHLPILWRAVRKLAGDPNQLRAGSQGSETAVAKWWLAESPLAWAKEHAGSSSGLDAVLAGLPEQLLPCSIDELEISVRSYNALRRGGVTTIGDLARLNETSLLKLRAFGVRSLKDVVQGLRTFVEEQVVALGIPETVKEDKTSTCINGVAENAIPHEAESQLLGECATTETARLDLKASVDLLDLSVRASNMLARLGIQTIDALLIFPEEELRTAEGMGRKTLAEVKAKLRGYVSGVCGLDKENLGVVGTRRLINWLLSTLPERQREAIADRYGFWRGVPETLQGIGNKHGLTRERIRQIEEKGLSRLRRAYQERPIKEWLTQKVRSYLDGDTQKSELITDEEAIAVLADDCSLDQASLAVTFLADVVSPSETLFAHYFLEVERGIYALNPTVAIEYKSLCDLMGRVFRRLQVFTSEKELRAEVEAECGSKLDDHQIGMVKRLIEISPPALGFRNKRHAD